MVSSSRKIKNGTLARRELATFSVLRSPCLVLHRSAVRSPYEKRERIVVPLVASSPVRRTLFLRRGNNIEERGTANERTSGVRNREGILRRPVVGSSSLIKAFDSPLASCPSRRFRRRWSIRARSVRGKENPSVSGQALFEPARRSPRKENKPEGNVGHKGKEVTGGGARGACRRAV